MPTTKPRKRPWTADPQQPLWTKIANLGDVNPVEYGGYFVHVDRRKRYEAEGELLIVDDGDNGHPQWTIYRFILEQCTYTEHNGEMVLSDNKFHPDYPVWFYKTLSQRLARPQDSHLGQVADGPDLTEAQLITDLCSDNPIVRADAYYAIGEYFGWENFDNYPRTYHKRSELPARIRRY